MERLVIIGGGIIGLATALQASRRNVAREIVVLEKDDRTGGHQSSHNSGVLHCGLYYKPGSLKARLAVEGIREMVAFCREHGIPHDICGKIVLAVDDAEVVRLRELEARGVANGLRGLQWLDSEAIREIEPHAVGRAALHVPEEGIVDYAAVMRKMEEILLAAGHRIRTNAPALAIQSAGARQCVTTPHEVIEADFVINCAGLHCDRVASSAGLRPQCRIIPFRGDYWKLAAGGGHLVRNLIYPVPDPSLPFLGVHFTRMIGGGIEAGPNAVLAFKREGYRRTDISLRDAWETLTFPGLYRFLKKYPGTTWSELRNSFSKKVFLKNLQRLIPAIRMEHISREGGSGVRAQAIHRDGTLLMDFAIEQKPGQLHLLNAPSPGATASLAIGNHLLAQWPPASTGLRCKE
jgi:L-2-hydroxyglutarate oxidase LhgO